MTGLQPITSGEISTETPNEIASLTAAWLWSFRESAHTRDAYQRDIKQFAGWCGDQDPTLMTRPDIDKYAAWLANSPAANRLGKPLARATVARKLASLSSWYGYLLDAGKVVTNPVARVRRPKIDRQSPTVGMTDVEATAVIRAAATDGYLSTECAIALAKFLVSIGARVSEVCALDAADLGFDSGHRTVKLRMKGGKTRTRAVPPSLSAVLDAMLAGRTDGPLFVTADGKRIDRHSVARFVRRCAREAGIPAAEQITPHSFRHAWATLARERGASLEERQYAMGHVDPRTTQGYDRARQSLDRDPSYLVAAATATED
jgi:site-specific recombinase XerD